MTPNAKVHRMTPAQIILLLLLAAALLVALIVLLSGTGEPAMRPELVL